MVGFARLSGLCAGLWIVWSSVALAQTPAPPPSQVRPPIIVPPSGGGRIAIPQVPAGAQIPPEANKLTFKLLGFDIQGEFPELVAQRKEIAAPLIGKTITVAKVFEFADKLQQLYVHAGYPLVRVVLLPQEFGDSARIKLRVIDGFVERMDLNAIGAPVRARVAAVLAPLVHKTHLQQSELERRLLLAGEAPGLILNATFVAGKQVGGSVLVLTGRYRPISASVYVDDAMPAAFGTGQVVTTAAENGLAGLGEQLAVSVAGDPEHDFFRDDSEPPLPERHLHDAAGHRRLEARTVRHRRTNHPLRHHPGYGDIRRVRSGPRQGDLRSDQEARFRTGVQRHVRAGPTKVSSRSPSRRRCRSVSTAFGRCASASMASGASAPRA